MTDKEREPDLDGVLRELTPDQIRWVIARLDCGSNREACQATGISEATLYRWGEIVQRAVTLMARDGAKTALHLRRRALARAMQVKVDGLNSRDLRVRQQVATEIIEWELGRAAQRQEVSGPGGGPIQHRDVTELSDDELTAIASQGCGRTAQATESAS